MLKVYEFDSRSVPDLFVMEIFFTSKEIEYRALSLLGRNCQEEEELPEEWKEEVIHPLPSRATNWIVRTSERSPF